CGRLGAIGWRLRRAALRPRGGGRRRGGLAAGGQDRGPGQGAQCEHEATTRSLAMHTATLLFPRGYDPPTPQSCQGATVKIVDVLAHPIRNTDLDRAAGRGSPGAPRAARAEPVALVVVEVLTDDGLTGVG